VRAIVLLPFGLLAIGAGLAAGLVAGSSADDGYDSADPEVVVREADGEVRIFTPEAASARIESL